MKTIIIDFYKAFNDLDANTMTSYYHDDIIFEDPVFGVLKGIRAKAMWQMLCESQNGKDFKVEVSNIEANENEGSAHWEAFYTFSKTGREVHNKIDAEFKFKDGLIISHIDSFSLYSWSKQALGFKGVVLGRTRYFKNKLRSRTNRLLSMYIEKKLSS